MHPKSPETDGRSYTDKTCLPKLFFFNRNKKGKMKGQ